MDREQCCAVYIDERVAYDRWISRESAVSPGETSSDPASLPPLDDCSELSSNIDQVLGICKQVYLCNSGKSFAGKVAELHEEFTKSSAPIFAFIDIALKGDSELVRSVGQLSVSQPLSPPPFKRSLTFTTESEEFYGFNLLSRFASDIQVSDEPSIIIPVAILRIAEDVENKKFTNGSGAEGGGLHAIPVDLEQKQIRRCLEAGAVDVLVSPFVQSRVKGLVLHAYRTQKAAQKYRARFLASRRVRRQSWVGTDDKQSYSYLREAMVSKLMKRICNPEEIIEDSQVGDIHVSQERKALVEREVGKWNFWSHEFSEDELVHAGCVMLEHALKVQDLEIWKIPSESIRSFLLSVRAAYNSFVLYHNFRHAIDVLQSLFHFLVRIGALPLYPEGSEEISTETGMASHLNSFDALTLLITAIGHDVGHPGVNNVFLVKLNAPLAQLYNDKSVLEAFHCAAYSQILRRHWPSVFKDTRLRKLMIDSILATDMGIHNMFMESLGNLQQRYRTSNRSTWGWEAKDIDTYRTLLCALLIKCADISNVARPFNVAEKWTDILQQEFANQGMMEAEIGMETALFGGPPELGNFIKKAHGQIGFMNFFALPLFDGVADVLPDMAFAANEIRRNKSIWQTMIDRQQLPEQPKEQSTVNNSSHRPVETRTTQDDAEKKDCTPPSVYYTIASGDSPGASSGPSINPSQLDGDSEDEDDEGKETRQKKLKNHLPSFSFPNTNGTSDHENHIPTSTETHTAALQPQMQDAFAPSPASIMYNGTDPSPNGVRGNSTSTYTNTTATPPYSSASQTSSLATAESQSYHEKEFGKRTFGQPLRGVTSSGYEPPHGDATCEENVAYRRPSTAAIPVDSRDHFRRSEQSTRPTLGRTASFMSSLIDKSFATNHNGFALKNPASPTFANSNNNSNPPNLLSPTKDSRPLSGQSCAAVINGVHGINNVTNGTAGRQPQQQQRALPRRRSRLRLAFWRWNKQSAPSPPPPLPNGQN